MSEAPLPPRSYPRKTRPDDPYADAPYLPGRLDQPVALDSIFTHAAATAAPIELEIGGGRGAFTLERLAFDADVCVLGLEIRKKWATIVDRKLAALGLASRGRVFAEDARLALPRLRPDGRVRAVFLHFPDPWWKKKHEKRLVMGEGVQTEIERLLCEGGELFVQTDVEHRALQYRAFLDGRAALSPMGDVEGDPHLAANPYGARSPREKRAITDGIPVHRLRYRKLDGR